MAGANTPTAAPAPTTAPTAAPSLQRRPPLTSHYGLGVHCEKLEDWEPIVKEFGRLTNIKVETVIHPWKADERYGSPGPPVIPRGPKFDGSIPSLRLRQPLLDEAAKFADQDGRGLSANWKPGNFDGHRHGIPHLYVAIQLFFNKALRRAGVSSPSADDPSKVDLTSL
jgi:hypothetical protein